VMNNIQEMNRDWCKVMTDPQKEEWEPAGKKEHHHFRDTENMYNHQNLSISFSPSQNLMYTTYMKK
jgi:hypothetical protein